MKIGLIAAMECELQGIPALFEDVRQETHSPFTFTLGRLHGCEVVAVCSGIGLVNAALAAQALVSRYGVDCVINPGVAGALTKEWNVCDVVVSDRAAYWDFDARQLMTGFPFLKDAYFTADEALARLCLAHCGHAVEPNRLVLGGVVSGQRFVDDLETKERLQNDFNAACVEMEGAAVAHVCALTHTPFLILRSISDTLNDVGENSLLTFRAFLDLATAQLAKVLDVLFLNIHPV
ncbi:MAG TPA: 5'-methylthioadenosine/adenosylhomocysteine nucleosidase [Clostridia bacterium]|nr:5'-methylthioadenosine/adenosylhomocysteine nucleosidase [Clostridia bacterium]